MIRHYLTHDEFEEIVDMNARELMSIQFDDNFKKYFDEFIASNTDIREIDTIFRLSGSKQTIKDDLFFFIDFVAVNWDGKYQVYEIAPVEEWLNDLEQGYAIGGEWDDKVTFDDFLEIINLSI